MARDPRLPWSFSREIGFDLSVMENLVAFEVQRKDLTWPQPAFFDDPIIVQLDRADFGARDHQTFGGDLVATRTQPIAIERGADKATIRERQRRGAVPWLDDWRVITVERLHVGREAGVVLPGGGHEHAQRVQDIAPGAFEQMEHFVQAG